MWTAHISLLEDNINHILGKCLTGHEYPLQFNYSHQLHSESVYTYSLLEPVSLYILVTLQLSYIAPISTVINQEINNVFGACKPNSYNYNK